MHVTTTVFLFSVCVVPRWIVIFCRWMPLCRLLGFSCAYGGERPFCKYVFAWFYFPTVLKSTLIYQTEQGRHSFLLNSLTTDSVVRFEMVFPVMYLCSYLQLISFICGTPLAYEEIGWYLLVEIKFSTFSNIASFFSNIPPWWPGKLH